MTKAINDATLTKAGDTFQHLIALKDCFDMESGETLQIEVNGDVSVINSKGGRFQKEGRKQRQGAGHDKLNTGELDAVYPRDKVIHRQDVHGEHAGTGQERMSGRHPVRYGIDRKERP